MKTLKERYNEVCEEYLNAFCEKYGFDKEPDAWVGGEVGGVACIADYYFGLEEIRYDIDHNCPLGAIIKWYDYMVRLAELECTKKINYKSFVNGAPLPYTEADLEKIELCHKGVEEAKKLLEEAIRHADNPY